MGTDIAVEVERVQQNLRPARSRAPRQRAQAGKAFAALDLGTNNCRLLVAEASNGSFAIIDAFSRIVRLGEGVSRNGSLSQAAMDRTITALRICSNKLIWHGVQHKRLVATEACRLAANGADFITRVRDELGLELEVINRETEARLAAAGASPLIDPSAESVLIFDIGGGSTELMWMERSGGQFQVGDWISLAAGVVTLSEQEGGGKDVSVHQFNKMREHVRNLVEPFAGRVSSKAGTRTPTHLLGTSGTVTTIAGIHLNLRTYDRNKVDGCWMTGESISRVSNDLQQMSYRQRIENGCIGRERADLVLAGCAILEEIRAAFPAERLRVADRGLREGILSELASAQYRAISE